MSTPIYIKIDDYWFDVTDFSNRHPGGHIILKKYHLKDATDAFNEINGHVEAYHFMDDFEIKDPALINQLNKN